MTNDTQPNKPANDDKPTLEEQVAAINRALVSLQSQIKSVAGATRSDRQVLDSVESNTIAIYSTIEKRLGGIETSLATLTAATPDAESK